MNSYIFTILFSIYNLIYFVRYLNLLFFRKLLAVILRSLQIISVFCLEGKYTSAQLTDYAIPIK